MKPSTISKKVGNSFISRYFVGISAQNNKEV